MKHIYEYTLNPKTGEKTLLFTMSFGPKKFISKYTIDKLIIKNNDSYIYKVINKKTKKEYICKVVNTNNFNNNEFIIPNNIKSNRIIDILEVYQAYICGINRTFMIMDYYPEVIDSFDYINNGKITESSIKPIIKEICLAIKDCHDAGYCHGDIKMENVIITKLNPLEIKLIDFEFSFKDGNNKNKFKSGTNKYIAPEVIRNNEGSRASDIWSIGSVIYYMIMDKPYNTQETIKNELISDELNELLLNCLVVDPIKRFNIDKIINSTWFKTP